MLKIEKMSYKKIQIAEKNLEKQGFKLKEYNIPDLRIEKRYVLKNYTAILIYDFKNNDFEVVQTID